MRRIDYESLEFSNGYIYKHCSLPLNNQGLVLIRGLNMDDGGYLGAGKSSIFEVFAQTQLGKGGKRDLRRGNHQHDVVNSFVGKDFESILRLRIDGHPFEIRYYRKHSQFANKVKIIDRETGIDITPRDPMVIRAPHKYLREQFLQLDETSFFNLVYMVQELNNVMVHGTEAERKNRLTAMFDLDVYDKLYKVTKRTLDLHATAIGDLDRVSAELAAVRNNLQSSPDLATLEGDLATRQEKLDRLQENIDQEMGVLESMLTLQADVRQRRDYTKSIKELFQDSKLAEEVASPPGITAEFVEEKNQAYDNIHSNYVIAKNNLERLRRRSILETQLAKISGRPVEEVQDDLTTVKTAIQQCRNTELPEAEDRVEVMEDLSKLTKPRSSVKSLEAERQQAILREAKLKNDIETVAAQLDGQVCPTCHRPYEMDSDDIASLQEKLSGLREQMSELTSYLHRIRREVSDAKRYKELKNRLALIKTTSTPEEVQVELSRYLAKEKALATELELSNRRLTLEGQLSDLPVADEATAINDVQKLKRRSESAKKKHEASRDIFSMLAKLKTLPRGKLGEIQEKVAALRRRLDKGSRVLTRAGVKIGELSDQVSSIRKLKQRERALQRTVEKREFLLREINCLEALKKSFSPKGLKQDRFHSVLAEATERTVPAYANILWPNRNVRIDISDVEGSIQFQLTRGDSGISTDCSLLSGGERHKSGMAFLFGIRDLKELYTGASSNLLIVDEPFGNLDPQGTESLISIFKLLKQKFDTIFVISHRPEVISHPVWDQTWWVIREDNNARLYTEDPPPRYQKLAAELVKQ